jgi:hypothetical protein
LPPKGGLPKLGGDEDGGDGLAGRGGIDGGGLAGRGGDGDVTGVVSQAGRGGGGEVIGAGAGFGAGFFATAFFFAVFFLVAFFIPFFLRAGAARFAFLDFFAFDFFRFFFAMIVLPIGSTKLLPTHKATTHHRGLNPLGRPLLPQPQGLATPLTAPAPVRRSPSRATRPYGRPGWPCRRRSV